MHSKLRLTPYNKKEQKASESMAFYFDQRVYVLTIS